MSGYHCESELSAWGVRRVGRSDTQFTHICKVFFEEVVQFAGVFDTGGSTTNNNKGQQTINLFLTLPGEIGRFDTFGTIPGSDQLFLL